MESQPIESTEEIIDNNTTSRFSKSEHCLIAWSAIGLLIVTWLCLLICMTFFWKKNNSIFDNTLTRLTQIQQQLSQTQTKYTELQKNLIEIQNVIQKKISPDDNIVRISEISQLIQLAHYNLIYLKDQNNALSALNLANRQLSKLINLPISLDRLQNLLNQNIASLESSPHLDLGYILSEINTLQVQITHLSLLSNMPMKETANYNLQTDSNKQWLSAIQASLHSFQQLISIRHLDKPIKPLLPQVQQQYLQHNLQLLLQQAQWALLHQQQAIYQSSLHQVKDSIQQYFVENSSVNQAIIQKLFQLEKVNLQPPLPDLIPTLQAVHDVRQALSNNISPEKKGLPL